MSEPVEIECSPDVKKVRLLIPDLGYPPLFSDEQINVFLELNEWDIHLAAADALDALATQMTIAGGGTTIRTDDLMISEKDGINGLAARAAALREQSGSSANDEFEIVYPFRKRNHCVPEATAIPWNLP